MRYSSRPVAAVGVAAVSGGLLCLGLTGCSTDKTQTVGFVESGPVSTVVIDGQTGDVTVGDDAGRAGVVDVSQRLQYRSTLPIPAHTLAGGVLTLSYTCTDSDCSVDYTVHVPAGTAVRIADDTGDITLSALTGAVQARTETGDVNAQSLASAQVELDSTTGDVNAGFSRSPASFTANTSTGDVSISLPGGRYAVRAQAQTGDLRVTVPEDAGSAYSISATSDTGNVTIS